MKNTFHSGLLGIALCFSSLHCGSVSEKATDAALEQELDAAPGATDAASAVDAAPVFIDAGPGECTWDQSNWDDCNWAP